MMKKTLLIVPILLLGLISAGAQTLKKASPEQSRKIIETLGKNIAAVKSLQCDFQQVKSVSFLTEKSVSKGKMYFSDGKVRWEYQSPYQYTFVINGQQIYVKNGDKTKKIDTKNSQMAKNIAQIMMNSLSGANLGSNNDFSVEMFTQGTKYVAKLHPKQAKMKKMFNDIVLYFSDANNTVEKIELNEASGDKTVITLSNVRPNVKVQESVFVLD